MRNFAHSIRLFDFDLLKNLSKCSEHYPKYSFALKIKEKLVPNFVQYFWDIQKHSSCIKTSEQISKDFCISWIITNNCCIRERSGLKPDWFWKIDLFLMKESNDCFDCKVIFKKDYDCLLPYLNPGTTMTFFHWNRNGIVSKQGSKSRFKNLQM